MIVNGGHIVPRIGVQFLANVAFSRARARLVSLFFSNNRCVICFIMSTVRSHRPFCHCDLAEAGTSFTPYNPDHSDQMECVNTVAASEYTVSGTPYALTQLATKHCINFGPDCADGPNNFRVMENREKESTIIKYGFFWAFVRDGKNTSRCITCPGNWARIPDTFVF